MRKFFFGFTLLALWLSGACETNTLHAQGASDLVSSGGAAALVPLLAKMPFVEQVESLKLNIPVLLKIGSLLFVFLVWVRVGDWANKDSQLFGLGYRKWNPILFFPFALLFVGFFFLAMPFWVRIILPLVVLLATSVPYILMHNKKVEPHQTVFTRTWWRYAFANTASKLGMEISGERKADYEKGAQVDLLAMGAENANDDNANLLTARHSPGYLLVKDLVVEMIQRRSDKTLLEYTKETVNVRHEIDGVWHAAEARDRESGDVMLAVIKTLANLDIKQRSQKQIGQFGAKHEEKSFLCSVASQGVSTGERVVLTFQGKQRAFHSYADLGMREALQKKWGELMALDQGLLILATLPSGGLTTITDVSLEETDRLMRDFAAIEEVNHRETDIQNVSVTTYDASAGEAPATILPPLIRTYPSVYVVRDFVNVETSEILLNEIRDERLVITNARSRDAIEALLRILQMKVPVKEFSTVVTAVLYQRLIRLLCRECKVAYTPPAEVLQKLGIPAGKVEQLYRPPKPDELDKPCEACQSLGYVGRTGVFELLEVNDQMREILVKQPKLELLRKAARAARHRSLQEEAIVLVAKGETSTAELMRILKAK